MNHTIFFKIPNILRVSGKVRWLWRTLQEYIYKNSYQLLAYITYFSISVLSPFTFPLLIKFSQVFFTFKNAQMHDFRPDQIKQTHSRPISQAARRRMLNKETRFDLSSLHVGFLVQNSMWTSRSLITIPLLLHNHTYSPTIDAMQSRC
jgi:uncharacterized BrkB/YihY/UPF0761 family membrane protein